MAYVKVFNKRPGTVEGPTINGRVVRFPSGMIEVPEEYVRSCQNHGAEDHTGTGAWLFSDCGPLEVLAETQFKLEPKKSPSSVEEETPPESLEKLSKKAALEWIRRTTDPRQLLQWGKAAGEGGSIYQNELLAALKKHHNVRSSG